MESKETILHFGGEEYSFPSVYTKTKSVLTFESMLVIEGMPDIPCEYWVNGKKITEEEDFEKSTENQKHIYCYPLYIMNEELIDKAYDLYFELRGMKFDKIFAASEFEPIMQELGQNIVLKKPTKIEEDDYRFYKKYIYYENYMASESNLWFMTRAIFNIVCKAQGWKIRDLDDSGMNHFILNAPKSRNIHVNASGNVPIIELCAHNFDRMMRDENSEPFRLGVVTNFSSWVVTCLIKTKKYHGLSNYYFSVSKEIFPKEDKLYVTLSKIAAFIESLLFEEVDEIVLKKLKALNIISF